jgi:hypothetical protein
MAHKFTFLSWPPVANTLPDLGPIFKQFVFELCPRNEDIFWDFCFILFMFLSQEIGGSKEQKEMYREAV